MTTKVDELRMLHGDDTDFQFVQIINCTDDADSTAKDSIYQQALSPVKFARLNHSLLTLSLITQFLTSVAAHNFSEFIVEGKGMRYKYAKTAT